MREVAICDKELFTRASNASGRGWDSLCRREGLVFSNLPEICGHACDPDSSPIDRLVAVVIVVLVVLEALVFVVAFAVEVDRYPAVVPVAGNPFGRAQGIR